MTAIISAATPADVSVCNTLDPPIKGVNVGDGIHVVIPDNWADLIAQGVDVPGCTYAAIQGDGSLVVSDLVQAELLQPAVVQGLPIAEVTDLNTKLATAVATPVDAQQSLDFSKGAP